MFIKVISNGKKFNINEKTNMIKNKLKIDIRFSNLIRNSFDMKKIAIINDKLNQ
jgi:hypothetical protein